MRTLKMVVLITWLVVGLGCQSDGGNKPDDQRSSVEQAKVEQATVEQSTSKQKAAIGSAGAPIVSMLSDFQLFELPASVATVELG